MPFAQKTRLRFFTFVACLLLLSPMAKAQSAGNSEFGLTAKPRVTYDLGAAGGSYSVNNTTYTFTEVDFGLNLFFASWLDFRNAPFVRFITGSTTIFGFDSSVRGILDIGNRGLGVIAFAGPGWRFENDGADVPFVEAGLVFKLANLNLGGGLRQFMHTWVNDGQSNSTLIFIILSGGGSL